MKPRFILLLLSIFPLTLVSRDITLKKSIYWEKAEEIVVENKITNTLLICTPCQNEAGKAQLPEFIEVFNLNSDEYIRSVKFIDLTSTEVTDYTFTKEEKKYMAVSMPEIQYTEAMESKKWKGIVRFLPLVQKNGRIEKVTSFEIIVETEKRSFNARVNNKSNAFKTSSVLSNGDWYKIAVDHNGVYKLSYKYLKQQNIDVDQIDPRTIAIFGNGGAMLPRKNADPRPDDLLENSIYVEGESDGVFNKNDFILFYGEGPHKWSYDDGDNLFKHKVHQFSDTTYYFLRVGGGVGKRIGTGSANGTPSQTVSQFNDYKYHEVDKVNLLKSGDDWFGEPFDIQLSYDFTFSFPNLVSGAEANLDCWVATASKVESKYIVSSSGSSMTINAQSAPGTYANIFARGNGNSMKFKPSGDKVVVNVSYTKEISSAKGWLDYIALNVRRKLILTGTQMGFRDLNSVGNNLVRFEISGASKNTKVWDVTDPMNPVSIPCSVNGSVSSFINDAMTLKQYMAIEDYDSTYYWRGKIQNQNLHSEGSYDYIIVSHPKFLSAAERLKSIHEDQGLSVYVTTPGKIYNEFSSGAQDIIAIRDFFRMIYGRSTGPNDMLKYALFMGDGSYDNKYRIGGNTNFIPTYESPDSFDPTESYVSDDFYCLLDSNEGTWKDDNELIDIGIGRMPVQSLTQANQVVDKIERYLSPQAMGDWRNVICFVGDDEDNNIHMRDANNLSKMVDTIVPVYNVEKIFIDAFKQFTTPGGARYPDAKEGIKRQVERGALIVSYTGHGGEVGWAHERILTMDEINNWTNRYHLPLFLTATCEFSRWDDPQRAAGGEVVLLNPLGGGIALLTTVRLVYSFANQLLATSFYNNIFKPVNGQMPRLGDVYKTVKNSVPGTNARNFTLLGDPALRLAYPHYKVITDSVNGHPIGQKDTVRALGKVTFKGHLEDQNGNKLSNYNGLLYPTVFDKEYEVQTLNNDGEGVFKYKVMNKKLFKGKAQISKGDFAFEFIIPKDIAYNYGEGKVSYYAENQSIDAQGYSYDFIVGGTDQNAADDKIGPDIELFMNDETFVYGGITDENPVFLAKVFDEHGINMAGTGIGHDITAILDGKTDEPIILNDYYSAGVNSYQEGAVEYPFEKLKAGPHKITLKVWDVYNNSSEATLEFVVQEFSDIKIDKVLNYPNPFTTNTEFWFEHNQPSTVLDVKIQIFTISGKLVKNIDKVIETPGYNQNVKNPITWDGRDEYGDRLARGVYVYKLQVRSRRNGSSVEQIEKLVIL